MITAKTIALHIYTYTYIYIFCVTALQSGRYRIKVQRQKCVQYV